MTTRELIARLSQVKDLLTQRNLLLSTEKMSQIDSHIVVKELKYTIEKVIVSNNKPIFKYKKIPRYPIPQHPMVNDFNQDLCGGWYLNYDNLFENLEDNINKYNIITFSRVFNRLKPAAAIIASNSIIKEWITLLEEDINFSFREDKSPPWLENSSKLYVSINGNPSEVFGKIYLDLVEEYYQNGFRDRWECFKQPFQTWRNSSKPIISIFDDKNWHNTYSPELGLCLGYPIENTLSINL